MLRFVEGDGLRTHHRTKKFGVDGLVPATSESLYGGDG